MIKQLESRNYNSDCLHSPNFRVGLQCGAFVIVDVGFFFLQILISSYQDVWNDCTHDWEIKDHIDFIEHPQSKYLPSLSPQYQPLGYVDPYHINPWI